MSTLEVVETQPVRLDAVTRQALLDSVSVPIPPREVATGYKAGMVLLASAMIGLSVGFVLLVGFLAWLGVWHLYNAFASLSAGPYFLFHLPMALLGLTLVVFMVKPIFLRPKRKSGEIMVLTRENEPLLFEYVERLSKSVNAPMPEEIWVDCTPNAAAIVDLKWLGLMGRKCRVHIGLPLAAAMSVSELTGILAHEMGHLTQRGGMFASQMVRRMTAFFGKVVFQRDRLDAMLHRLKVNRSAFGQLIYWVAVIFIEPARGVLWLMLLLGELLSMHFLRRMEFDADWLEAQVYGPGEFEKVSQEMLFLDVAANVSHRKMRDSWEQRRLADDFPRLIVSEAAYLRTNHKELIDFLEKQKTRWFDSHPCHSERVLNVRDLNLDASPKLVKIDQPAGVLFSDFDDLCRRATQHMYKQILKEDISKATYVATAQMTAELGRQPKRYKMLDAFFAGQAGVEGPVFPQAVASQGAANLEQWTAALQQSRDALQQAAEGIGPRVEELQEANVRLSVALAQRDLANLFPNSPQAHGIHRRASNQIQAQTKIQARCREYTNQFAAVAAQRFTISLQLAVSPVMGEKMRHSAAAKKLIDRYLPLAHKLRDVLPQIETLRQQAMALRILCSAHSPDQPYRPLVDRILSVSDFLLKSTQHLRGDLEAFTFPFEHAIAGISVGKALNEDAAPKNNDPPAVHAYATTCIDRYYNLSFRVLSQLATVAAAAETSLNFKPLTVPPAPLKTKKRERSSLKEWLGYSARAAAGLLMLGTLLAWSFNPPNLSWASSNGGSDYRPAAFSTSVQHFNQYDPSVYVPPRPYSSNSNPQAQPIHMGNNVNAPPSFPRAVGDSNPPESPFGRGPITPPSAYPPGYDPNAARGFSNPNTPGGGAPAIPRGYTPPMPTPPTPRGYTPPSAPRGYTPPSTPGFSQPGGPGGRGG